MAVLVVHITSENSRNIKKLQNITDDEKHTNIFNLFKNDNLSRDYTVYYYFFKNALWYFMNSIQLIGDFTGAYSFMRL